MKALCTLLMLSCMLCACDSRSRAVTTTIVPKPPLSQHVASEPMSDMPRATRRWQSPASWQEQPAGGMRLGSFAVQGAGDASIIELAAEAGGVAANVNRWLQQLGLPPQSLEDIAVMAEHADGKAGAFQWFDLKAGPQAAQAMLVAIIPFEYSTVFVKLTGPAALLAQERENFLGLCRSIQ